MLRHHPRFDFLVAVGLGSFTRGAYITALAWSAMAASGDVALVGVAFVIGHAINLVMGPGCGVLLDRFDRRRLALAGQLVSGTAFVVPYLLDALGVTGPITALFATSTLAALGVLIMSGALDAIQQAIVPVQDRRSVSALVGALRQGSMIAGTGGAGLLIHWTSSVTTFLMLAACCLASTASLYRLPTCVSAQPKKAGLLAALSDGVRIFFEFPVLGFLAALTALSFAIGQLSNVLLPGFVAGILHAGSREFGLIDSAWSVGGLISASLVSLALRRTELRWGEVWASGCLGVGLLLFGYLHDAYLAAVLQFLLGFLFSAAKVLCDGKILVMCPPDIIGRVRSNCQALIGACGICIYLSPIVLRGMDVAQMYRTWGVVVTAVVLLCFLLCRPLLRKSAIAA